MKRHYNWNPDPLDGRDHAYLPGLTAAEVPNTIDLRALMTKVEDQGALGSCTANAGVALYEYLDFRFDRRYLNRSRLFLYWFTRYLEGSTGWDSGAYIRDVLKAMAKYGICAEYTWPYDISRYRTKPPASCIRAAAKKRALEYMRVDQTQGALCAALADGFPVVFGFAVYESFESAAVAATGVVPMPKRGEALLGGHAVVIVGYDLDGSLLGLKYPVAICRNSWGTKWGKKGYFFMPLGYVLDDNLAEDFWIVREVAGIKLAR